MAQENRQTCGKCGREKVSGYITWGAAQKKVDAENWVHGSHRLHHFPLLALGGMLLTGARVVGSKFSNTQPYCENCGE